MITICPTLSSMTNNFHFNSPCKQLLMHRNRIILMITSFVIILNCFPFGNSEQDKGDNKFSTEFRRTGFYDAALFRPRLRDNCRFFIVFFKISLRFFESLCSINEENWTNDFFSLPFRKSLRRLLFKTLVVSFLRGYNFPRNTIFT